MNDIDKKAATSADNLLAEILKTQPALLEIGEHSDITGRQAGDFIAALRQRLIEMYQTTPR